MEDNGRKSRPEEFDIENPDEEAEKMSTVGDAITHLNSVLNQ